MDNDRIKSRIYSRLRHLKDVDLSSPTDEDILVYDVATDKYILKSAAELGLGGGGLSDLVDDTTPQLGGDLDTNGNNIVSTSNGDITIAPNGTGDVILGNFVFDADQTVGAGQDNYIITYDNATGKLSLEVAPVSGLANIVEDTTPQLGGDLDANGFNLEGVTPTEMGYVSGVTSDIQTQINSKAATSHTHPATDVTDFDTEVANNTDVAANTAKVSADGLVTTHSDVTDAGSGAIITAAERTKLTLFWGGFNKLDATAAPTASDDASDTSGNGAFSVGSVWIDLTNDEAYRCVDSTATTAVWVNTSLESADLSTVAITGNSSDLINDAGFISDVVSDTTPQLGGNLDANGFNIEGVTPTEMGYVSGVTSDIQTQINSKAATVHTHVATDVTDFDTEVSNNTSVAANTAKVSADGSVTSHSDVTDAGSGAIITGAERTTLGTALQNIIEDTTPQLGGTLDTNGQKIDDIKIDPQRFSQGTNTTATGNNGSFAQGQYATATGEASVARGKGFGGGTNRNIKSTGIGSFAMGSASNFDNQGVTASGNFSFALGNITTATGSYGSFAQGNQVTATGYAGSFAQGRFVSATGGTGSFAQGKNTIASGIYGSFAQGGGAGLNVASGSYGSFAQGYETTASGNYGSFAQGNSAKATGSRGSFAQGNFVTATGSNGSFAQGNYATATGVASVARGAGFTGTNRNIQSTGKASFAMGSASNYDNRGVTASGNFSFALGDTVTATGFNGSFAQGNRVTATADNGSFAQGISAKATGTNGMFAQGLYTMANGYNGSFAQGYYVSATGSKGSFAQGLFADATGNNGSFAQGNYTTADGRDGVFAQGHSSTAKGNSGVFASGGYSAIGATYKTLANGNYGVFALGVKNTASGNFGVFSMGMNSTANATNGVFAMGSAAKALGFDGSFALGYNAEATGDYGSFAQGQSVTATGSSGCFAMGSATTANSAGSFAFGAGAKANAAGAAQFGAGTNSQADTLRVKTGPALSGTTPTQGRVLSTDANGTIAGLTELVVDTGANGSITIAPNGTGNVILGNFEFDADQVVGVGTDNYVLTYDSTSGTIQLEAAAGGGGSGIPGEGVNNGTGVAATGTIAAIAQGSAATASGNTGSFAQGENVLASGAIGSFAMGFNATASGNNGSFAVGSASTATGAGGFAFGAGAKSNANGAIQFGNGTNSRADTLMVGSNVGFVAGLGFTLPNAALSPAGAQNGDVWRGNYVWRQRLNNINYTM